MPAYTFGTIVQLPNAIKLGAMNLFSALPALPAPKMPIAKPCCSFGNQRATYGVPTENAPPAKPIIKPINKKCQY